MGRPNVITRVLINKRGSQKNKVRENVMTEAEVGVAQLLALKMEWGHEPRNAGEKARNQILLEPPEELSPADILILT